MMEASGVYFSPVEFLVMLDMAGEEPCSILFGKEEPDDSALTVALASLFRRGLIRREGNAFSVSAEGEIFARMRSAPAAVFVSGPRQKKSVACYADRGSVLLVEPADIIVRKQYRVQRLDMEGLEHWLYDTGILRPPALQDEDVAELSEALDAGPCPPPGDMLAQLDKYENGGVLTETFRVYRWKSERMIVRRGAGGVQAERYTVQSVRRMLADCFLEGT